MRTGLVLLVCLALPACNTFENVSPVTPKKAATAGLPSALPPPEMNETQTVRASYACDDGSTFDATFDNTASTAIIVEKGASVTLPNVVSGSGFRYADKTHELAGKGDDAMWTVSGKERHCTAKS